MKSIVFRTKLSLTLFVLSTLCFIQCNFQAINGQDVDIVLNSNNNDNNDTDTQTEANLKRPERVTLVAPRYLRPQSEYRVLINLANSEQPASIDVQLTGARDSNREQVEAKSVLANSGETQMLKFSIGDWPDAEYILSMTAQAVDRSWNFTQETRLTYLAKTYSAFIQTDKAIYRPGQLVQFRAVFLNPNLAPLSLQDINVTVHDPKNNLIKEWTTLSNYRGLLTLELPLSEDPPLGDWTIRVSARNQEVEKRFRVAEYILPTFDVNIHLPTFVTYNEPDLVASVHASYTYGKPVNGHLTLTVQPLVRFVSLDTRPLAQSQFRSRLINGTAEVNINLVKDLKLQRDLFEREIEFFALVEEDLTGRKYNKTEVLKIHDKQIKIERINQDTFKPGLGYLLQLKVAYQDDTPVEDNGPELELHYSTPGIGLNETVRVQPIAGIVEHLIQVPKTVAYRPQPDRQVAPTLLEIAATYRGQQHYLNPIDAYHSSSEQYMQISLPQLQQLRRKRKSGAHPLSVHTNDELKIKVQSTEPMEQVTCHGMARGDILWALSRDARNKTEFEFELTVDQRMAPEARILCFYIRPENKEIIADSVQVTVDGLLRNIVRLSASREEAKPGQEVEVGVITKPNSLVGVLGIDQSVLLLKSGNDISQQDLAKEIKSYGAQEVPAEEVSPARNVHDLFQSTDVVVLTNNLVYEGEGYLEGRLLYAEGVFAKQQKNSRSAKNGKLINLDRLIADETALTPPEFHIKRPRSEPLVIRSFFPETWLWDNATSGADGIARFKAKVPDTITSWVLSAFSINEAAGFGLSNAKTSVRVFRPFFVKLNLPYSIIRGETVNIQAVVFNYLKRSTSAKVTLENRNGDFEFVEAANNIEDERHSEQQSESRLIRIPAQDGVAVSFLIRPKRLGNIDIRVVAQGETAGDGLVRKLLVKPEGQTQYMNKPILISLAGPQTVLTRNFSIDVPANTVPDSQKVYVSAVGDLMGAGLSNVDDLLRLPYGCGEQNMINLVPNIVILNYLETSKRLRETQRSRAVRNIESGYQRQLNYKRSDGSFSAFGKQDANGSVWLTAYVLKTLQQAKKIITVDESVLRRAANFIARYSRSDGSIEEVGMLHNKRLQSAASDNTPNTYLTAYAMIALLQRPIKPDGEAPAPVALDEVLDRGLNYLEAHLDESVTNDNPYELAIITYALHLANRRSSMDKAYDHLWSRAQEDQEFIWWEDRSVVKVGEKGDSNSNSNLVKQKDNEPEREYETIGGEFSRSSSTTSAPPPLKPLPVNSKHSAHLFIPDSLSIEMTALALLTTVRRGELERALPVVRWLIKQQNSNGGFASTQDTVLAIEALASFAEASIGSNSPLSIDLELVYPREARTRSLIRQNNVDQLLISKSNALVNQQIRLPDNITWVQVQATGVGAAVVQVSWQYNLLVSAEQPAFYLNPILDKSSNINYLQLSVCTYYKAGEASNMAVMEVELPSGYVADVEALPGLTRTKDVKRVDTADGDTKVLIYFDRVTRDEICITVPAHQTSKVSNNKPMPVSIYDYYNRQQAARIFYSPQSASSCDICDLDNCSEVCSTKPKRSGKYVSLHDQRKVPKLPERFGNITAANGGSSSRIGGGDTVYQILPLAPVLMHLMAVSRSLFNHTNSTG